MDVKRSGQGKGAETITTTKNEMWLRLNKPDESILAIVEVEGESARSRYVRDPFKREPDSGVASLNYDLPELLSGAEESN